ncbi:hypothetical protein [Pseudomonas viridiflava]|uniref:hypothetical protein n=1 Tax=Pseudomonas viridiflava TaxID=33069 RepID=UPI000F05032D|nr:hypothetical protein [Pseudomonas viridiflava]
MQSFENLDAVKNAQVQIKSFKQAETHRGWSWSFVVYLNGKRLGLVSNDGSGSMTRVDFKLTQQKQFMLALKSAGYKLQLTCGDVIFTEPETVETWLEFAVGQIGVELDELKSIRRRAKTQTFVEKRSEPRFAAFKAEDTPANRAALQRQLGSDLVRFMNDAIRAY